MQSIPLGFIQVPTPGTPVPLTLDRTIMAAQILVRTMPGLTGKTYFGIAGMNKNSAGKTGVIRVLAEPGSSSPQDGEAIPPGSFSAGNPLRVADYFVDADVVNEGVMVTYFLL